MYQLEIEGLQEQVDLLGRLDEIADQHLMDAMGQTTDLLVNTIQPLVPVFRGALQSSIGSKVTREAAGSIVGVVGSSITEAYPVVMEFGRAPGAAPPPASALEAWAQMRFGDSSLAYVIARSIGRKGIAARSFMKRGLEASRGSIKGFFDDALKRITDALVVKR